MVERGDSVVWDRHARAWRQGTFVTGGSPWRLLRLGPRARGSVVRLRAAGPGGLVPERGVDAATADLLIDRGVAHPRATPRPAGDEVVVVVPAYGRPELLDACLRQLEGSQVVVVDDASPEGGAVRVVVERHGARLVRHATNAGPAAARNTALAASDAPIVAFLDSDCTAPRGWVDRLLPYFDDPRVGAVAPRIRPRLVSRSALARHEHAHSSLDMGPRRALVRPGGAVPYLPSAALLVRREALGDGGFEAAMRVGEDVDLVWRLVDAGWHVRYEPDVEVEHEMRLVVRDWVRRRYDYGTSAAVLEPRHPGRLAPVRISGWNAMTAALLAVRRPRLAALTVAVGAGRLAAQLRRSNTPPILGLLIVGRGLVGDTVAVGHALRREWWPLGWGAITLARRSPVAAAATLCMVGPLVAEQVRVRPALDPVRYVALRLLDDAAYGTGVIAGAVRGRRPAVLVPRLRWPRATPGRRRSRQRSCQSRASRAVKALATRLSSS